MFLCLQTVQILQTQVDYNKSVFYCQATDAKFKNDFCITILNIFAIILQIIAYFTARGV